MPEYQRPLKVFLCHSSADKLKVRELYRYLHRRGIKPWFDEMDLVGGQDWQVEIPKALSTSDAIIICLTKNSVDREGYVQKEIKFALDKALEMPEGRIFLIPVRFEECDVPFSLSRYQWVDLFDEAGYTKMMRALKFRASQLNRNTIQISSNNVDKKVLLETATRENSDRQSIEQLFPTKGDSKSVTSLKTKRVELILEGEFSEFNTSRQIEITDALATLLAINIGDIRILRTYQSSIGISIEMPSQAVDQLYELAVTHDIRILNLGIKSVLVDNKEIVMLADTGPKVLAQDFELPRSGRSPNQSFSSAMRKHPIKDKEESDVARILSRLFHYLVEVFFSRRVLIYGFLGVFVGGFTWNILNNLLGWPYYLGGPGNEPRGFSAFIWGSIVVFPVVLCAYLAYYTYTFANLTSLWRTSIIIALYSFFGGVGAVIFYNSGLRSSIEAQNWGYGNQELFIVFVWSLVISFSASLPALLLSRVFNELLDLRYIVLQILLAISLSFLAVVVSLFIHLPESQVALLRGFLAGLGLRLGLFVGIVLSISLKAKASN